MISSNKVNSADPFPDELSINLFYGLIVTSNIHYSSIVVMSRVKQLEVCWPNTFIIFLLLVLVPCDSAEQGRVWHTADCDLFAVLSPMSPLAVVCILTYQSAGPGQ